MTDMGGSGSIFDPNSGTIISAPYPGAPRLVFHCPVCKAIFSTVSYDTDVDPYLRLKAGFVAEAPCPVCSGEAFSTGEILEDPAEDDAPAPGGTAVVVDDGSTHK